MSKIERYKKICDDLQVKVSNEYKNKKIQIYSYIRLGLLAKYNKSIKAISYLDRKGFFEDANIILRTVFEDFITIVYCEIDPIQYYKRFFDYNVVTRLGYVTEEDDEVSKIIQSLYKEDILKLKLQMDNFKKVYNTNNTFSWNNISVKKICKELDKHYNTSFYSDMYTIIYMQNSEFIHPNIVNIFENYINIVDKKININTDACADKNFNDIIDILEECNNKIITLEFL